MHRFGFGIPVRFGVQAVGLARFAAGLGGRLGPAFVQTVAAGPRQAELHYVTQRGALGD